MKKEIIGTASLIIALFVLLFGNNWYQQLTGHSLVSDLRLVFTNFAANAPHESQQTPRQAYSVTRSEVDSWTLGEVITADFQQVVENCLNSAHAGPRPYIAFQPGDSIPIDALIATDFKDGGKLLSDGKVTGICHNGGWGLFESKASFTAVSEGAYWHIVR
jgi:hypothetical protein